MAYDEGEDDTRKRGRLKERGERWKKRGDQLFGERDQYNSLFQAQAEIFYPERADPAGARVPTAFEVKGKARDFARAVLASAPERSSLRGKVGFDDLVRNMAVVAAAVQAEKGYLPHDVQLMAAYEMLQGKLV